MKTGLIFVAVFALACAACSDDNGTKPGKDAALDRGVDRGADSLVPDGGTIDRSSVPDRGRADAAGSDVGAVDAPMSADSSQPASGWIATAANASGWKIEADAAGNTYMTGSYEKSITFGGKTLTSRGKYDSLVAKLDATGKVVWVVVFGGSGDELVFSIDYRKGVGLTLAGTFGATVTLGGKTVTSKGKDDIFVARLDEMGAVTWVTSGGGTDDDSCLDQGPSARADGTGSVFLAGCFRKAAMFGTHPLTGTASRGTPFWARMSSSGGFSSATATPDIGATGMAADTSNNMYVTGFYTNSPTWGTYKFPGGKNGFLITLGKTDKPLSLTTFGASTSASGLDVRIDAKGAAHLLGLYRGTMTVGSSTFTSNSQESDPFLARPDGKGGLAWAVGLTGDNSSDPGASFALDSKGNYLLAGFFLGTRTFGATKLTSVGPTDIVVYKVDSKGKMLWVKQAGGSGSDWATSVAVDGKDRVYVTGQYENKATMAGVTLPNAPNGGLFVWQIP